MAKKMERQVYIAPNLKTDVVEGLTEVRIDALENTVLSHSSTLSAHSSQISALADWSTGGPMPWGTLDGSQIWRAVIYFSPGPNNEKLSIDSPLSGLEHMLQIRGVAFNSATNDQIAIPDPGSAFSGRFAIWIEVNGTHINLCSKGNYSGWYGYVILDYTGGG